MIREERFFGEVPGVEASPHGQSNTNNPTPTIGTAQSGQHNAFSDLLNHDSSQHVNESQMLDGGVPAAIEPTERGIS